MNARCNVAVGDNGKEGSKPLHRVGVGGEEADSVAHPLAKWLLEKVWHQGIVLQLFLWWSVMNDEPIFTIFAGCCWFEPVTRQIAPTSKVVILHRWDYSECIFPSFFSSFDCGEPER